MTRLAVAALAAIALASAVLGAAKLVPHLDRERDRWAGATKAQAARAVWSESPLPPALFDWWHARLRRGDRYYVQAPVGANTSLTSRHLVQAYAAYWLLPAVQVRRLEDADAVVSYRADPRGLGVPLAAVATFGPGAFARVRR